MSNYARKTPSKCPTETSTTRSANYGGRATRSQLCDLNGTVSTILHGFNLRRVGDELLSRKTRCLFQALEKRACTTF